MSARRALTADSVPLPRGTGMLDSDSAITKGKHQARTTGTEPASFPFYPAWAQKQTQIEMRKN